MAVTGAEIAARGLSYIGSRYIYGGAMGTVPNKDQGGDCSGFFNGVLCRDLGLAGPGIKAGTFTGAVHGPPVIAWATWSGAVTLPQGRPPVAGDMCVWPGLGPAGHIGIAVSSTEMVSALNPELGVLKTPIAGNGPAGVKVVYRRITGVVLGGGSAADAAATSPADGGSAGAGGAVLVLLAGGLPLLLAALALTGALVGGVLAAGLVIALARGGQA